MTDTPQPTPAETPQPPAHPDTGPQTNVYPASQAPAAPPAAANPNAGVTAGAPAPNSAPAPGRGMPIVAGPAQSVKPKMSATGLNIGFLIFGIVAVALIVYVIYLIIHAL